ALGCSHHRTARQAQGTVGRRFEPNARPRRPWPGRIWWTARRRWSSTRRRRPLTGWRSRHARRNLVENDRAAAPATGPPPGFGISHGFRLVVVSIRACSIPKFAELPRFASLGQFVSLLCFNFASRAGLPSTAPQ